MVCVAALLLYWPMFHLLMRGDLKGEDSTQPGSFIVRLSILILLFAHRSTELIIYIYPVPPVPGSLVVNWGYFLMRRE